MKVGDRVRCIEKDAHITVGATYVIVEKKCYLDNDAIIAVLDDRGNTTHYYTRSFELIKDIFSKIKDLTDIADTMIGKSVVGKDNPMHFIDKVKSYNIYLTKAQVSTSSSLVQDEFEKSGFVVALQGESKGIPVNNMRIREEEVSITLTSDYNAIITKDEVVVGCQTIPRSKIIELYEIMEKLQ